MRSIREGLDGPLISEYWKVITDWGENEPLMALDATLEGALRIEMLNPFRDELWARFL